MSSFKKPSVLLHSSPILFCAALPAPMLNLHNDSPIPLGFPFESSPTLNSQSAIWFLFASGQSPMYWQVHASAAPKLLMVCFLSFRWITIVFLPSCGFVSAVSLFEQP